MDENQQAKGHNSQELFRFQTTAPCRYCDAPDLVPVSPAELARIADYVGVTKEEALREYCRHEPLYRYFPRVTLKAGEDGRCPFATERGCALRGVRPWACQLFPLEATPAVIPTGAEAIAEADPPVISTGAEAIAEAKRRDLSNKHAPCKQIPRLRFAPAPLRSG